MLCKQKTRLMLYDICHWCSFAYSIIVDYIFSLKWPCYIVFAHVISFHWSCSIVPKWPLVVSREWRWVAYVLPECWFISVPANFRFSICPLFSKSHAEIFREFRHDLCYKLGHIECPGFAAPGRSQRSCKTISLFMSLFILLGLELID